MSIVFIFVLFVSFKKKLSCNYVLFRQSEFLKSFFGVISKIKLEQKREGK